MSTPWMTAEEVAAYLKVHPNTVYRLAQSNEIPHTRIGRSVRFNLDDVETWLKTLS